jgi:putative phage-type endonuclease
VAIIDCVQGSPEWRQARTGRVTASRVADVLARIKSGEAAGRRNYRAELVCEVLTGMCAENGYVSKEMQWGTETEPFARAAYEVARDVMVDQVGFVVHPDLERFGASPDGLAGSDGMVEIKCPNTATHISYLLEGKVPSEYQPQMLAEMACADRKWCDFVSFDPRLPKEMQLFVRRFMRDEERIAEMEQQVRFFLSEVDEIVKQLRESVKTGFAQAPEPAREEKVVEPPKPAPKGCISPKQLKRLLAIQGAAGMAEETLKGFLKGTYGIDSRKLIPAQDYDAVIEYIDPEHKFTVQA